MAQPTRASAVGAVREVIGRGRGVRVVALVGLLLFGAAFAWAQTTLTLNVSGYELFPGIDCTLNNQPATCGATFGGWTGGGGAVAGGWTRFPGNRLGFWEVTLDRQGTAAFGSTVTVLGGKLTLALKADGTQLLLSGSVMSGGTVQWPPQGGNLGCGTDIAHVDITLQITTLGGAPATFTGCLHDLPAGSIIPPTVWGTLKIL
jgi:hypothetical protein